MASGIDIDISEFLDGIDDLNERMLRGVRNGLDQAASALLNDSITKLPAVPLDEGTLRGSGAAYVNNELVAVGSEVGANPAATLAEVGTKRETQVAILLPGTITGTVAFNTPYAAYQHEGERQDGTHKVQNYKHSGTGAKFLEKPLFENAKGYMGVVSREIRKALEA